MTKPSIIPLLRSIPLAPLPDYPAEEMAVGSRSSNGWYAIGDGGDGVTVGLWEAEPNETKWIAFPFHNFMLVIEGELAIETEQGLTKAKAGEALVVPQGLRCRYIQPAYVKIVVFAYKNPAEPSGHPTQVIKIDTQVKLSPSTPPSSTLLHSPVPVQHAHEFYRDPSGQLTAGVWDTTGYHRKLIDFPRHEVMHLLEGSVTFIDDKGKEQSFKAGDTFLVPLGTPNAWKSEGYLKKIYCIFQPA